MSPVVLALVTWQAVQFHPMRRSKFHTPKLATLSKRQLAQVKRWLIVENITYSQCQVRLKERFGLTVSQTGLSEFYSKFCAKKAPPSVHQPLELRLERCSNGWRLLILTKRQGGHGRMAGHKLKSKQTTFLPDD